MQIKLLNIVCVGFISFSSVMTYSVFSSALAAPANEVSKNITADLKKTSAQQKNRQKRARIPKAITIPQNKPELQLQLRPYEKEIRRVAQKYALDENLIHAIITTESHYKVYARGKAGEIGLMQIKSATARMLGYKGSIKKLYTPSVNLEFGARYLAKAKKLGNGALCNTILKYNAGHAATRMNSVSLRYCHKVKTYLQNASYK